MRSVVVFHVIWGLAVSIRDSDMRLDAESLVHSDAKDECEEKLRKAIDENAKLVAESTSLRNTMEDVKDLKVKVDKLKGQLIPTAPNASNASATDDGDFGMGCCCRVGRCHRDEEGVDGTRAVEVPADRCCKQQFLSAQHCSSGWENASASDCTSAEMEMLERFNRTAVASENHQQSECQHELLAVWDGIQKWTDNLSLHGHWIHSIHSRHLSETIQARLFVTGFPFEDGAVGARLFGMAAGTKLLMSGMSPDSEAYKTWKSKEHAGSVVSCWLARFFCFKKGRVLVEKSYLLRRTEPRYCPWRHPSGAAKWPRVWKVRSCHHADLLADRFDQLPERQQHQARC